MKNRFLGMVLAVAMAGSVLFTGCGISKSATVVTIDDGKDTISLGYANFVARYTQSMYDGIYVAYFGEDYWTQEVEEGKTYEASVKEGVMDNLENAYVLRKHAKDYDVKITDDEKKQITEAAKAFLKANSKSTRQELTATQDVVEQYLTDQTYINKMQKAIKAKAKVDVSKEDAAQRTFSYVSVPTVSDETDESGMPVELTEDELAERKEQAEKIASAEDFDAAVEDAGLVASSISYGKEEQPLNEAVIKAADKLSEGEVSPVIEVEGDGYYVVRLDSEYDEEATQTQLESMEEQQRQEYYESILEGWKKEVKWTINKKQWAKVKFDSLFEMKAIEE